MSLHVALLRGINVGGRKSVAMADLRQLCEGLGLADARSLLQSGNLIFTSEQLTGPALETLLEKETAARLGLSTVYIIRRADELHTAVARNPVPEAATDDPGHLILMFLKTVPAKANVESLRAAIQGPETIRADGKHLYITYPAGIGRSKLTNALIEKKLATQGTGRNWNTLLKLAALCQEV